MKNKLLLTTLSALICVAWTACGDDDKDGKGTGAKTAADAAVRFCEDFAAQCAPAGTDGSVATCAAQLTDDYDGDSEACQLASINAFYCMADAYSGDFCEFDMNSVSESESERIAERCLSLVVKMSKACGEDEDPSDHGDSGSGTGASTFAGAAKKYCADFVLPCDTTGAMTNEGCVSSLEAAYRDQLAMLGEKCIVATLNYTYCVEDAYSGDFCTLDMETLSAEEQQNIGMACIDYVLDLSTQCPQ